MDRETYLELKKIGGLRHSLHGNQDMANEDKEDRTGYREMNALNTRTEQHGPERQEIDYGNFWRRASLDNGQTYHDGKDVNDRDDDDDDDDNGDNGVDDDDDKL